MKSKLVLTSTLLTFIVLVFVSAFFTYEYSLLAEKRRLADLTKEFELGASEVNEFLVSKKNEIDFLSGINLLRVSLDFSRKEELSEFLNKYVSRYKSYENIIVLDKNKNYFASKFSVFDKDEISRLEKELKAWRGRFDLSRNTFISLENNITKDAIVVSEIKDYQKIGYIIALIKQSDFKRIMGAVDQRCKKFDSLTPKLSLIIQGTIVSNKHCLDFDKDIFLNSKSVSYCLDYKEYTLTPEIKNIIYAIVISMLFLLPVYYFLYNIFVSKMIESFNSIINKFDAILRGEYSDKKHVNIPELQPLSEIADKIILQLQEREELQKDQVRLETVNRINQQVAHDIRSPLAALEVVHSTSEELSEDLRVIFKTAVLRIKDIVNQLSKKESESTDGKLTVELVSSLLENIISEKRVQYRSLSGVSIELFLDESTYGLFSKLNVSEFKRVISNLINNSVEALPSERGEVKISVETTQDKIKILIVDNGQGVSSDKLSEIWKRGISYNKENLKGAGSGLGLSHAKEQVEKWGGEIEIESSIDLGTKVLITLDISKQPYWFVPAIKLPKKVIVIDDDDSIHQIWKNRFHSFDVDVKYVRSAEELKQSSEKFDLYLIDYEFLGLNYNGLDIIKELDIANKSILITSHFEDLEVRQVAASLGVRIIPKGLAAFVPIK